MGGIAFELGSPSPAIGVTAMLRSMRHRGRDGARVVATDGDRPLSLGYAATWFLDEDVGSVQPVVAGDLLLAFDGRVDDRVATAAELHVPIDSPDATIAAAAIAKFGDRAAARLRGEFSFVAVTHGRIVAAADRLGAVPLYYRWSDGDRRLRIASEKQALFADEAAPPIDFAEVALALSDAYTERDGTFYQGIHAIPPGHLLVVEGDRSKIVRYFALDPHRSIAIRDPRDASAWLRSVLTDVIRDQSRARGGIASTVSGGLDSTTVAALATSIARERGTEPPLLVTVRYPDDATNETAESQALADHLRLPLHVHDVPSHRGAFAPSTHIEAMWDPYSVLLDRMLETARAHGRRSISLGFGGDEIQRNTGFEVGQSLAEGDAWSAVRWAGPMTERWAVRRLVTTTARHLAGRPRRAPLDPPPEFLRPAARDVVLDRYAERTRRLDLAFGPDVLRRPATRVLFEFFADGDAAPFSLAQGAHAAAQLGVAFLQPFLDVRVVELLLALPLGVRPDTFSRKPLLRSISEDVAPPAISRRIARANFMPFYQRVLTEDADAFRDLLGGERLSALGLASSGTLRAKLNAALHDASEIRTAMTAITYEAWLAALDRRPEPTRTEVGHLDLVNASVRVGIVW